MRRRVVHLDLPDDEEVVVTRELKALDVQEIALLRDHEKFVDEDVQKMIRMMLPHMIRIGLFMFAPLAGAPRGGPDGEQSKGEAPQAGAFP